MRFDRIEQDVSKAGTVPSTRGDKRETRIAQMRAEALRRKKTYSQRYSAGQAKGYSARYYAHQTPKGDYITTGRNEDDAR